MKYLNKEVSDYCERCNTYALIQTATDGGYYLCRSCAGKMIFDREHPND